MKKRIYNLIILDESGSMWSIAKQAVDGVNESIQTIRAAQRKNEDQEHFVTLVTFNDEVRTLFDCVSAEGVEDLKAEEYDPNCCTALYDAMGISLNALKTKVKKEDKVLVTIVTDGCENASKEYNGAAIKLLVDNLKAQGWVFAYLGANHDVEKVAATISITNVMQFEASMEGTSTMMHTLSRARSRLYENMGSKHFCSEEANNSFFEENF
ncbi:MAG: VWA domain-containing protein [Alistipes sp.]|nr:VWA domain-containing protein [Alistipes sp.]